jgi:ABC-type tungstate transport system substrate-binding protein
LSLFRIFRIAKQVIVTIMIGTNIEQTTTTITSVKPTEKLDKVDK